MTGEAKNDFDRIMNGQPLAICQLNFGEISGMHARGIRTDLKTSPCPFTNQIEEQYTPELKLVRATFATHQASDTNTFPDYILTAVQGPAP